jgi:HK97 family phage prohead protease
MTRNFTNTTGVQRRTMAAELRTAGDEFALTGYAATFNSLSKNLGGFREQIAPNAFKRSLASKPDVKCLFNHAPDNVLGRTKSGTLELSTDSHGLKFRCQLDKNSQYHKDIYSAVKRGDIDECSFAFTLPTGGQTWTDSIDSETNEKISLRTITDADLIDVSVVTYPAYNETQAGARSHGNEVESIRVLNEAIKTLRKAAKLAAPEIRRALQRSDASPTDFASLGEHLRLAHEMAECACATSDTVRSILDSDECEDEFCGDDGYRGEPNPDNGYRSFKKNHAAAHAAIEEACSRIGESRLVHSKVLGRKKK